MTVLDDYTLLVEEGLSQLTFPDSPRSLYDPCRYVMKNGGKRLRPVLTLMASGLCGGNLEDAVPAALSVELIHNFTLVHDDIMDQASSRRGQPSVHVRWDEPTAILAGDMLYAEAFQQLLCYSDAPGRRFQHLQRTLLKAIRTVCEGQALDMKLEREKGGSVEEYLDMIRGKTAALISCSLKIGGISAGASQEELQRLDLLGDKIGLAFQIQDDLMDAVADPEKFGKTRGGDILEGKKTFLLLTALENGNETDVRELYSVMDKDSLKGGDIDRVVHLFRKTGALKRARDTIGQEYRQAMELLEPFDDSDYKADLVTLLNFLIDREY
ncbi:MAG: polyprenyl synthetase family protein [Balneolaceae bacterium]